MNEIKTSHWSWNTKLLTVMLLMCVGCIAYMVPAVMKAREDARRSTDKGISKQLWLASANFDDVYKTLPSERHQDGKPTFSWQTQILPFMERQEIYDKVNFDLPWDDIKNRPTFETEIRHLHSSSLPTRESKTAAGYGVTSFSANQLILNDKTSLSPHELTDGQSQTILYGEIRQNLPAWGQPGNFRDLTLGINKSPQGFGGFYKGRIIVSFVDGKIDYVSENIDPKVLEALATPNAGDDPKEF